MPDALGCTLSPRTSWRWASAEFSTWSDATLWSSRAERLSRLQQRLPACAAAVLRPLVATVAAQPRPMLRFQSHVMFVIFSRSTGKAQPELVVLAARIGLAVRAAAPQRAHAHHDRRMAHGIPIVALAYVPTAPRRTRGNAPRPLVRPCRQSSRRASNDVLSAVPTGPLARGLSGQGSVLRRWAIGPVPGQLTA
jgi:hypothetical protein